MSTVAAENASGGGEQQSKAENVQATPEVDEQIMSVTNGVTELQQQIDLLQQQHELASNENKDMIASLVNGETSLAQKEKYESRIKDLEEQLKQRTEDRDNYMSQLEKAEARIAELLASGSLNLPVDEEREAVQGTLEKLTQTLKEQTGQCERFERQNTQLMNQVKALKEVVSVHKDLLNIRSLESDQLKTTIKLLEQHAQAEKDRRTAVLSKMESAVKLNSELKQEYETQLRIFQELKIKYEIKLSLLSAENARLRGLLPPEQCNEEFKLPPAQNDEVVPVEEVAEQ